MLPLMDRAAEHHSSRIDQFYIVRPRLLKGGWFITEFAIEKKDVNTCRMSMFSLDLSHCNI